MPPPAQCCALSLCSALSTNALPRPTPLSKRRAPLFRSTSPRRGTPPPSFGDLDDGELVDFSGADEAGRDRKRSVRGKSIEFRAWPMAAVNWWTSVSRRTDIEELGGKPGKVHPPKDATLAR
ncbi:hypothetical protein KM043_003670 [Ampulex compressa]|nr:hypothetical protein KM043_003670 [Ampulex compressa]